MKVRILRQPHGTMNGVRLNSYHVGRVYDMPATIATYLVVEEFAAVEMRKQESRPVSIERRKPPRDS